MQNGIGMEVPSKMGEAELNRMVAAGILPDRVTAGWRLARSDVAEPPKKSGPRAPIDVSTDLR